MMCQAAASSPVLNTFTTAFLQSTLCFAKFPHRRPSLFSQKRFCNACKELEFLSALSTSPVGAWKWEKGNSFRKSNLEQQLFSCCEKLEASANAADLAHPLANLVQLLEETPPLVPGAVIDGLLKAVTDVICLKGAHADCVTLAIHALGSLSRSSPDVKSHMLKRGRTKAVYEVIITHVKSENKYAVIASLACLSTLAVHDACGAKILSGANLSAAMSVAASALRRLRKDPGLALLAAQLLNDLLRTSEVRGLTEDAAKSLLSAWTDHSASLTLRRSLLRATSAAISCEEENGGSTFCEAVRALPVSDIPAVAQAVCSVAAAGETPDCLACWGMVAQIAGAVSDAHPGAWDASLLRDAARKYWRTSTPQGLAADDTPASLVVQATLLDERESPETDEDASRTLAWPFQHLQRRMEPDEDVSRALSVCLRSGQPCVVQRALKLLARRPATLRQAKLLATHNKQTTSSISPAPAPSRERPAHPEPPAQTSRENQVSKIHACAMDEMQAAMAKLELEKDVSAHEAQQLHVRVSMLEGAARELDDLRKKYDEQTKRLDAAYTKLVQQAADAHRRAQENTALARKCADLRDASSRLVEQLSASRESEDETRRSLEARVQDAEQQMSVLKGDIARCEQQIKERDGALAAKDAEIGLHKDAAREAKARAQATQQALKQAEARLATQAAQIEKYRQIHQLVQSIHSAPDEGVGLGMP